MNTVFYSVLRQRCNEIKDGDPVVDKVLDAYDCILDFQEISKEEGLLSLEVTCENLDMNDAAQNFFKYLIILVVDGTEPGIIEEIGMNKYLSSNLTGVDGLIGLMYFRACLLIQAGYNAHLVEEYMKSLLPRVYIESLNKRDMNNALSKEENKESEDEKILLEWCTDKKEISESDYSIVNQTARALLMLSDRDLQRLLRDTSPSNLAVAMKGLPGKVRKQVFDNLSTNSKVNLVRDIDYMGPVRVRDIEQYCAELLENIVKQNSHGDFSPNDFSVMKVVLDMYKAKQNERQIVKEQYRELKQLIDQIYQV